MPSVAGITDYFSRGERERKEEERGWRKKEEERRWKRERREEGEEKVEKKRRKNCIGRCFIEIRGEIYLDVSKSSSSSFQSFVFLYFFFFFHLSPRKNIASRPEDRAQNADKFMRILESSSATLDYSRAFVFFFSFFYIGLRLRPIDTIRAVDYYSVDRLDWNVYWKI